MALPPHLQRRTLPLPIPARCLQPVREVVRPANQLALSAGELEEEVGRSLTAGNPTAPANLVRYSFRERGYRAEPIIDQQLQHFALGGCLMHCESEEAARQRRRESQAAAAAARSRRGTEQQSRRATGVAAVRASEAGAGAAPLSSEASLGPGALDDDAATTRLRNQFNFADRAAQTGHHPPRDRATRTEPPPTAVTAGSCSRWEIYEAYVQDQERQRQTEELARQKAQVARKGNQQAAAAMAQRAAELALAPAQWVGRVIAWWLAVAGGGQLGCPWHGMAGGWQGGYQPGPGPAPLCL